MNNPRIVNRLVGLFEITLIGALTLVAVAVLFPGTARAQDYWGRLQMFEDGDLSRWQLTGTGTLAIDSAYATQRKHSLKANFSEGSLLRLDLRGIWRMEEIIREKFSDEGGGGWRIYEAFFTDIYTFRPIELLVGFSDSLGGSWKGRA